MKERTISVTEASRNFAECINRVRYQGISFLLVKNGSTVARLIPATGSVHPQIEGKIVTDRARQMLSESLEAPMSEASPELPSDTYSPDEEAVPNAKKNRSLQW